MDCNRRNLRLIERVLSAHTKIYALIKSLTCHPIYLSTPPAAASLGPVNARVSDFQTSTLHHPWSRLFTVDSKAESGQASEYSNSQYVNQSLVSLQMLVFVL
jgi:hypothetical protein